MSNPKRSKLDYRLLKAINPETYDNQPPTDRELLFYQLGMQAGQQQFYRQGYRDGHTDGFQEGRQAGIAETRQKEERVTLATGIALQQFYDYERAANMVFARIDMIFALAPGLRPELLDSLLYWQGILKGDFSEHYKEIIYAAPLSSEQRQSRLTDIDLFSDTTDQFFADEITLEEARERLSTWRPHNEPINEIIGNLNFGGRPSGVFKWKEHLAHKAAPLFKQKYPKLNRLDIWSELVEMLNNEQSEHANPVTYRHKADALQWLMFNNDGTTSRDDTRKGQIMTELKGVCMKLGLIPD